MGARHMEAISPLVATAILLIATVAGGIILYNYLVETLSAPGDYVTISPVSAKIIDLGNGTIYVNVKVVAVGTRSTTIDKITILPENIEITGIDETIKPGETRSITLVKTGVSLTNGKHYIIIHYEDQSTEPIEAKIVG